MKCKGKAIAILMLLAVMLAVSPALSDSEDVTIQLREGSSQRLVLVGNSDGLTAPRGYVLFLTKINGLGEVGINPRSVNVKIFGSSEETLMFPGESLAWSGRSDTGLGFEIVYASFESSTQEVSFRLTPQQGEVISLNGVVRQPLVCRGNNPANAVMCPNDGVGVFPPLSQITKRVVVQCTETRKCEFSCNRGYVRRDGGVYADPSCVAAPVLRSAPAPNLVQILINDIRRVLDDDEDEAKTQTIARLLRGYFAGAGNS